MNLKVYQTVVISGFMVSCYLANVDTASTSSNLTRCFDSYKNMAEEAMARFIEASGKRGSGIYGGNTLWYGSYSECQKIHDSRYCLTTFPGSISLVPNRIQKYHVEWGVCIPKVCTSEDVSNNFLFFLKNVSNIHEVTPLGQILLVKCAEDAEYTASVVITIIFIILVLAICLLATIFEILGVQDKPHNAEIVENGRHISMGQDANENTPLISDVTTKVVKHESLWYKILHCFSMVRNVKWIMNTNVGKSDLTYLHGIRVLSLFWIILLHVNNELFTFFPTDNLYDVESFERRLPSMILYTTYGVDTFFVLSGLLVMYTNMSKKVKNNGHTNWLKYYFHRFWRLTPTLMFCVLLVAKLRPFLGAGPLWYLNADTSHCSDNWWTNLLYLNNFIPENLAEMCIDQTWYLAADMQMFVISPIFFFIAYRYKLRALLCAVGVVILASIVTTACLAGINDTTLFGYKFVRLNMFFNDDQDEVYQNDETVKDIYAKPYCRIPPYVMGIVLGYVLYQHFSKDFKLSWKFVAIMWISAVALALTDVYAPYSGIKEDPRVWTRGERTVFWSLRYSIWGLCIVWLIFACHYNYAGLVKNILAGNFWVPLSRMNYAAFIIHFDVMQVLVYNIESPVHFTSFTLVTYFLSTLVLTYAVAFVIAVVVELPCANLEALFWRKWEKK